MALLRPLRHINYEFENSRFYPQGLIQLVVLACKALQCLCTHTQLHTLSLTCFLKGKHQSCSMHSNTFHFDKEGHPKQSYLTVGAVPFY